MRPPAVPVRASHRRKILLHSTKSVPASAGWQLQPQNSGREHAAKAGLPGLGWQAPRLLLTILFKAGKIFGPCAAPAGHGASVLHSQRFIHSDHRPKGSRTVWWIDTAPCTSLWRQFSTSRQPGCHGWPPRRNETLRGKACCRPGSRCMCRDQTIGFLCARLAVPRKCRAVFATRHAWRLPLGRRGGSAAKPAG